MDITIILIFQPIFNILVILYRFFGENLGLAIIAIAIISRVLTLPIILRQRRSMVRGKEMTAKVNEIKERHKNDKEKQQKEVMAIQSEYLPGQLAGCLPTILQLIVFLNVYNVIRSLITGSASVFNKFAYSFVPTFPDNYKINFNFLNLVDLSKRPSEFSNNLGALIPYLIILLLVGVTQYFSMKYMMSMNKPAPAITQEKNINEKGKKKRKGEKDEEKKPEDLSAIVYQSSQQTLILLPILYMFIGYNTFESGLGLYWIVTNTFVIIQQLVLNRPSKTQSVQIQSVPNIELA